MRIKKAAAQAAALAVKQVLRLLSRRRRGLLLGRSSGHHRSRGRFRTGLNSRGGGPGSSRFFNLHVKNQIEGASLENEINVLQTIVPNDPTFKLLERGNEYVLFLDEYIGPVASNAYVICGVNLGKIEVLNDTVILNSRQKESFKILRLNNRNDLMSRIKK